jgi:hypothetical protein
MRIRHLLCMAFLLGAMPSILPAQDTQAGIAATVTALANLKGDSPTNAIALRIADESILPRAVSVGAARALGFTALEVGGRSAATVLYEVESAKIGPSSATFEIRKIADHGSALFEIDLAREGGKWAVKQLKMISIE